MNDIHIALQHFGADQTVISKTLQTALSKGADFAELFFQDSTTENISLEDHAVNKAFANTDFGVGVRAIRGDQVGYAYSETITPESLLQAANVAANIANSEKKHAPVDLSFSDLPSFYVQPNKIQSLEIPARVELLSQIDEQIFAKDERIVKAQLSLQYQNATILIANSEGTLVSDFQPMLVLIASVVAEQNGRREQNRHNIAFRTGFEYFTPEKIADFVDETVTGATDLFEAELPKGGELEVVLGAGGSGILLHEAIGHGLEADFNRKKLSIFSDSIGKQIADKSVTIIDDGTTPNNRGAINVDDEGVRGQRTTLVENGVLTSYIHDRISAKHYGVEPTGNGRRQSFRHEPMPRMRNTYMTSGDYSREEIVASVKHGIYADSFTNGQVNIGGGDFTFYVKSGYLIENGKFTQPIKDVNIIGNGPKVLADISMVGNDMEVSEGGWTCGKSGQGVPVSIGIPSVKVAKLTVGGK